MCIRLKSTDDSLKDVFLGGERGGDKKIAREIRRRTKKNV
jgi:hypothetical protein